MKFFFLNRKKIKTISDYKLEVMLQKGKDEFQKLVKMGIDLPITEPVIRARIT